jgi:hypothetical protein
MQQPIQLLEAKKAEILEQFQRVQTFKYNASENSKPEYIEAFEKTKKSDLDEIKTHLDRYSQAIKALEGIENMMF